MSVEGTDPGFWDYLKAAFFARKRVPGLGGLPLNVLALLGFGVAGLVNPGFLLIGAGLEVGYLAWLSSNQRFRNLVRGERRLAQAQSSAEALKALVQSLSRQSQARFQELLDKCGAMRGPGAAAGLGIDRLDELQDFSIESLLRIYARLLLSRESLLRYLMESSQEELDRKLRGAEKSLREAETEGIKRSLEANIEILRKRLSFRQRAAQNLKVIEAELDRIENQVSLVREELTVNRDPSVLSARVDAIASTIGEASQFLQANELLLGDLGAPDVDLAPPSRPRVRE